MANIQIYFLFGDVFESFDSIQTNENYLHHKPTVVLAWRNHLEP